MEDRIREIIAKNLNLSVEDIEASGIQLEFNKTNGWDSLSHLTIMMELEDEFDVEISIDDMETLINVTKISDYLSKVV